MAKATKKAEVIPAVQNHPDLQPTANDGQTIGSFLANLIPFFREAQALEAQAKEHAALVLAIKAPKNSEADEALQVAIRACAEVKKRVTAHWTITTLVHQFHKRLVAARDRGVKLLDQAADHGNALHNAYVREQREIAQREQDRIQRERDAETARLAEDAEEASSELSVRERAFVTAIMLGEFPAKAAAMAGFKDAERAGARLISLAKIQTAIESARAAAESRLAETPKVQPAVTQAPGAHDRTTRSAELFDEAAFLAACLDGIVPVAIASRVLTVRQSVLNDVARSMGNLIDAFPGVRLKEVTRVV